MTDPIADMLTRIKNALTVRKETVEVPASNMKREIARILVEEGYVKDVKEVEDGYNGKLVLTLKYTEDGKSVIGGLKRVSKPGLRVQRRREHAQSAGRFQHRDRVHGTRVS